MKWLVAVLVGLVLVGVQPLKPPKVKRGEPHVFLKSKLDPAPYKAKTLANKVAVWFKETADGKSWWLSPTANTVKRAVLAILGIPGKRKSVPRGGGLPWKQL